MPQVRVILLPLVLFLGVALAACSSDEPPQAEPSAQATAAAQAEQPQEQQAQPQAQAPSEQPAQQSVETVQQEAEEQTEAQSEPAASAEETTESQAEQVQAQPQQQTEQQTEQQTVAQAEEPSDEALSFEGVPGIVDPSNHGWPREVEGLGGVVSIPAKPLRIVTASIGHDEVVLALVPSERLVAVGAVSKDATYSNIAELVLDKPEVSRDPETIIVAEPDIVVTSPWYPVEGIDALQRAGILVIQTALELDPQAQINNVLLIGYMLGEEERAIAFAGEVQARYQAVLDITAGKSNRPSVLSLTQYGDSIWTAGVGSTQGELIEAAGGLNAAAEVEGNQTISLESVIAMSPDVIFIPQPAAFGAEEFRQSLFENEALAEVPAIRNEAVYIVDSKLFTTLSHWNIRGAEELARILWPDDFTDPPAASFSLPE